MQYWPSACKLKTLRMMAKRVAVRAIDERATEGSSPKESPACKARGNEEHFPSSHEAFSIRIFSGAPSVRLRRKASTKDSTCDTISFAVAVLLTTPVQLYWFSMETQFTHVTRAGYQWVLCCISAPPSAQQTPQIRTTQLHVLSCTVNVLSPPEAHIRFGTLKAIERSGEAVIAPATHVYCYRGHCRQVGTESFSSYRRTPRIAEDSHRNKEKLVNKELESFQN